jgi:EpsI family protein
MISRREIIIAAGLTLGGGAVFAAGRQAPGGAGLNVDELIPNQIGEWNAQASDDIILPPSSSYARSVYEQVVTRRYVRDDQPPITLVIASNRAQSYASQLHRPEICYPASNFKTIEAAERDLSFGQTRVPAGFLTARRGPRTDYVLYWTRIGDQFPNSLWEQRRMIAGSVFKGGRRDGVVVRFSVTNVARTEGVAVMDKFAQDFYASLSDVGQDFLLGGG